MRVGEKTQGDEMIVFTHAADEFRLCLTRVTLNSLATDKPVALGYQIELEFRSVGF